MGGGVLKQIVEERTTQSGLPVLCSLRWRVFYAFPNIGGPFVGGFRGSENRETSDILGGIREVSMTHM